MTLAVSPTQRASQPSGLADVLDVILDKGIVIDAFVRVSLVGIELLTVDARVVIASVDTYLRFAEAVNRLDIQPKQESVGLPGLIGELQESGAEHKTRGALSGMKDSAKDVVASLRGDSDDDEDDSHSENGRSARRTNGRSRSSSSRSSSRRPVAAGRRSSRDSDED